MTALHNKTKLLMFPFLPNSFPPHLDFKSSFEPAHVGSRTEAQCDIGAYTFSETPVLNSYPLMENLPFSAENRAQPWILIP